MQTSIASVAGPPSPATIKKLLRIRMMSEMVRTPAAGNIVTIPTQVADISEDWVKMVVNQWKVGSSCNQSWLCILTIMELEPFLG